MCDERVIAYTREQLFALCRPGLPPPSDYWPATPSEVKRRRRGCRAGVKVRERRKRHKPAVPAIIMGNVRSLGNKTDELTALVRTQQVYRECSLMCFTETWLQPAIPDYVVAVPGFKLVRADRDAARSGKRRGGGVALFVSDKWCNSGHITVKKRICTPDIELLGVGLRPYYLPREFTSVMVVAVYIPPTADGDAACDTILSTVMQLQTHQPCAFTIITGDFNHVTLDNTLPHFSQFVVCSTRDNRTLDLLYANAKEAYSSTALPPLGRSDHNLVLLTPKYVPLVKRQPVSTRSVRRWTPDAEEELRGCFEATDWNALCGPHAGDIDGMTDCITEYIKFCEDVVMPARTVRCYPNNKPWITKDLKVLLNEKKRAFRSGDIQELRRVQRDLKEKIRGCHNTYRRKLEAKLQQNNTREVWRGMKEITGCNVRDQLTSGTLERANELNCYFNRFSCLPSPVSPPPPTALTPPLHTPPPPSPFHPEDYTVDSDIASDHLPGDHHPTPTPPLRTPPPTHPTPMPRTPPLPPLTPPQPPGRPLHPHPPHPPWTPPSIPLHTTPLTHTLPPPDSSPHFSVSTGQVRRQLEKLKQRRAAGPDGISPRVLKSCAPQLSVVLQHLFNLSLSLQKVPALWKTSCLIPVPKKTMPSSLSDYRPVALTSHVMKVLERLVLSHLRPQVRSSLDPLQFAYQPKLGVDDAVIYLLQRAHSHLDGGGSTVRITFFDFSSAFNTIQPVRLGEKLLGMNVNTSTVSWITDYLTGRPQFVRLGSVLSGLVVSDVGSPQGTVLSPFLFTLYTSDFKYNSELCHLQKYSDDSAVVGCIRDGQEGEYRELVDEFVDWSRRNHLLLNVDKTREMVIDFRKKAVSLQPLSILGKDVEMVEDYRYLGVSIDNGLNWGINSTSVYKKGISRLYFLRRLRSFNVCSKMLEMFYQSVVASTLFFAVACWGGSIGASNTNRLNKLIRKAGSIIGCPQDTFEAVVERRSLDKLLSILDNVDHPLHHILDSQRSSFSHRLIQLRCRRERFRRSFLPFSISLYNKHTQALR